MGSDTVIDCDHTACELNTPLQAVYRSLLALEKRNTPQTKPVKTED